MKYKTQSIILFLVTSLLGLILIVSSILVVSSLVQLAKQKELKIEKVPQHTKYEIVLECQKLSSWPDEDWGYFDCIKELEDALKEVAGVRILKT